MQQTLILENISKSFHKKTIYQQLNFSFSTGCHAILGKNGIGKTLLLEMLACIIKPDTGKISIYPSNKNSPQLAYKKKLIYVPQQASFFPTASAKDYLEFILALRKSHEEDFKAFQSAIENYHLTDYLEQPFGVLSFGTQKKLFLVPLANAKQQLILLDEPSNGLDASAKRYLIEQIADLKHNNIIIVTTHDTELLDVLNPDCILLDQQPINSFKLISCEAAVAFIKEHHQKNFHKIS